MNRNIKLGLVVLILVALAGVTYYLSDLQNKDNVLVTDATERVVNEELEFSFAYENGEESLSYIESQPEQLIDSNLKKMYVFMESKTMADFHNETEPSETPPTISILIFDNPSSSDSEDDMQITVIEKIKNWAIINNNFTNINLTKGQIEEISIDGVPAIKYEVDGLYAQNVYLARYSGQMYLFVGQYLEAGDYLDNSFNKIVNSVWFQ